MLIEYAPLETAWVPVLGDEVAASLGLYAGLCRGLIIFTAALPAASAVFVGGLPGFVGLIAPHAFCSGRTTGGWFRCPCFSASARPAFVIFRPYELPVDILLSVLGAPFFLVLIVCGRRLRL